MLTRPLTDDPLRDRIAAAAAAFPGVAGVAAEHLRADRAVLVNADSVFPTASTAKILVLHALLRASAAGHVDLRERVPLSDAHRTGGSGVLAHLAAGLAPTLDDLAVLMMALSDNTAANLLIDRLGLPAIAAATRAAGLASTELRGRIDLARLASDPGSLGAGTPREFARLLGALHRGDLLPPAQTERLFEVMRIQKYIEPLRRHLPADPYARDSGDPEPVRVASKTGSLSGIRCEVGVVEARGEAWSIAVMTRGARDARSTSDHPGVRFIAEVSRLVYDAWGTPAGC